MLFLQLSYLPFRRRDMILDHENSDFFGSLEGYEEVDYSSKEEKKNRKAGLLNWFKLRVCIFVVIYGT